MITEFTKILIGRAYVFIFYCTCNYEVLLAVICVKPAYINFVLYCWDAMCFSMNWLNVGYIIIVIGCILFRRAVSWCPDSVPRNISPAG